MVDDEVRRRARRASRTGDPIDAAAALRGRVRVGRLRPELLELVALCGDPGAVRAVDPPVQPLELGPLVEHVVTRQPHLAPWVAVVAFRLAAPRTPLDEPPLQAAVAAAEVCLRRPNAQSARAAIEAAERPREQVGWLLRNSGPGAYNQDELTAYETVVTLATEAAHGAAHKALPRRYGPPTYRAILALEHVGDVLRTPDCSDLLGALRTKLVELALR